MPDDRENPAQSPDNPFDAWLASAPAGPANALCPWCSAPLEPPDIDVCAACGAQLRGGDAAPIPGVTVVDPEAVRRTGPVKPPSGAGLFTWLTGDRDLVDAALSADATGGDPSKVRPAADIGPVSRDAIAPPDPRVRREMRRIGRAEQAPGHDVEADDAGADGDDRGDPGAPPPDEPPAGDGPDVLSPDR